MVFLAVRFDFYLILSAVEFLSHHTAPRAVIGQIASTFPPRTQT